METIKETCKCGAVFEVVGNMAFCTYRYEEFLKAHLICREKLMDDENIMRCIEELFIKNRTTLRDIMKIS